MKLYAQLHLDPGTFTLLNNLSIPFAAILFRIVMRRKLTAYQVCALVILVTGLVTSKLTVVMGGSHHQHLHETIAEVRVGMHQECVGSDIFFSRRGSWRATLRRGWW